MSASRRTTLDVLYCVCMARSHSFLACQDGLERRCAGRMSKIENGAIRSVIFGADPYVVRPINSGVVCEWYTTLRSVFHQGPYQIALNAISQSGLDWQDWQGADKQKLDVLVCNGSRGAVLWFPYFPTTLWARLRGGRGDFDLARGRASTTRSTGGHKRKHLHRLILPYLIMNIILSRATAVSLRVLKSSPQCWWWLITTCKSCLGGAYFQCLGVRSHRIFHPINHDRSHPAAWNPVGWLMGRC